MSKTYKVYRRKVTGTEVVAEIVGDKVTGPDAGQIRSILVDRGWPAKSPDRILHGMYLWAAEVSTPG